MPHLRAMQTRDLDRVLDIETAAYPFPWTAGIFRDCLRSDYGCWVLETAHGALIGYAILSVAADEAHVLNICIAPPAQGRGHGRRLMRRLLDLARWHGARRVFLEVRPSNPNAITLYQSLGFAEVGRRPRYYPALEDREDAIVMECVLVADAARD